MDKNYQVDCFWSEEDEGFIAIVPDLHGCSAFGDTRIEAMEEVSEAIDCWLEAAESAGNPIPPVSARNDFDQFSGKVLLRMPRELHADMHFCAKKQNTSLNQFIVFMLTKKHYAASTLEEYQQNMQWHQSAVMHGNKALPVVMLTTSLGTDASVFDTSKPKQNDMTIHVATAGVTSHG